MSDANIDKGFGNENRQGATSAIAGGITYIIAIGIDKYGFGGISDFVNDNCVKDCMDFVHVLLGKYENCKIYKASNDDLDCLTNEFARKENIEGRIQDFIDAPENNSDNNLIIYFSGHGDVIDLTEENTVGCLVPYGVKAITARYLIDVDILIRLFKSLKVRHFLFIADACKSGAIFNELRTSHNVANTGKSGTADKSKWALVSSRANELSKAGRVNENSVFTRGLLDILENNKETELLITDIIAKIDSRFIYDEGQKPYSGRLIIDQTPNSGLFVLKPQKELLAIKKRKSKLQAKLRTFNYEDQREQFVELGDHKYSFTIFRGTPFCGLWHLSKLARQSASFATQLKDEINHVNISPALSQGTDEHYILNLLSSALKRTFNSVNELAVYLTRRLQTNDMVIEIRYYFDDQKGKETFPPKFKKIILDRFADVVNNINQQRLDDNRLFLFVVDEEDCDYKNLYSDLPIAGVVTNFIKRTDPLQLPKAKVWYQSMKAEEIGDQAQKEFNSLFEEVIYKKLPTILDISKGYPGSFIREVCLKAECKEIADEILDP